MLTPPGRNAGMQWIKYFWNQKDEKKKNIYTHTDGLAKENKSKGMFFSFFFMGICWA